MEASMGKAPTSDSFMAPDKMKPLLALSKREPVQAAIGLTADGDGVILLDKKLKPKKVLALLKSTASKQKIPLQPSTLRFGKAEVDTDYDPGMVRFFVNKEPPGNLRVKLLEVVKRIPYQKVELNVQPSLEDEPEDEEQEAKALKAQYDARWAKLEPVLLEQLRARTGDVSKMRATSAFAQEKAGGGDYASALKGLDTLQTLLGYEEPAEPPPEVPPPPSPPTTGPAPDAGALSRDLANLVRRIPEVPDTSQAKPDLVKQANAANVAIKTGNLRTAADLIAKLRDELGAALESAGVGIGRVTPPQDSSSKATASQDANALTKDLTELAGRIKSLPKDDRRIVQSLQLAAAGRNQLKANDLKGAQATITQLHTLLGSKGGTRPNLGDARRTWQEAKETAGLQIGQLQDKMRATKIPLFAQIADRGLNGITGRLQVGLQVALAELDGADEAGRATAVTKARASIADFRDFLRSDPVLPLLEENPLGVTISLRADLSDVLDKIEQTLA
jgi:hypothetical protein